MSGTQREPNANQPLLMSNKKVREEIIFYQLKVKPLKGCSVALWLISVSPSVCTSIKLLRTPSKWAPVAISPQDAIDSNDRFVF